MGYQQDRVDVRGTTWFVAIAIVPAWLMSVPLFVTGEGLSWSGAPYALTGMMFMPALAALVVNKWISPAPKPLRATGLTNPGGLKKWWHYALLAWFGPPLIAMLALVVGHMLGVYHADWTGFSGLAERSGTDVVGQPDSQGVPMPLVLTQLGQVFLLGWVQTIPALGEELGWRGYLAKALLPLGQPGAFVTTGVLWGLWHAPILILGYNYPNVPVVVAFIMMVCFCVLVGTLLSWIRLSSGSVWPAAIAHGFLNSAGALGGIFAAAGHPIDNVHVGLLGWSGWIVLALVILILMLLGKLPVRFAQAPRAGISRGVNRLSRKG
ncbi:CPBP family intramembrane glutamic endopeptidase [Saccharopolyspora griseoalba]|uniref:CPBP family intramembrane glutamic endopeptidase n=1 Tax=Saccharopolyspora griseoalba TaxID=1431848 RepID=A0ABW2LH20_9PSEU